MMIEGKQAAIALVLMCLLSDFDNRSNFNYLSIVLLPIGVSSGALSLHVPKCVAVVGYLSTSGSTTSVRLGHPVPTFVHMSGLRGPQQLPSTPRSASCEQFRTILARIICRRMQKHLYSRVC